jgi:glyoxylase-like metal-dependent hydrolase (beta-lactamase superfamily II)
LAVTELKLAYDIPFYINKNDEFLVKNMQDSAKYFLGIEVGSSPVIDQYLEEEQIISLGQSDFRIVETPGHTPGSVCFHCQKNNFIFTGDLLFADGGVGRTDFSYSKPEEMGNSLAEIFKLPGKTVVYPGHGRSTTLAEEKKQQKW